MLHDIYYWHQRLLISYTVYLFGKCYNNFKNVKNLHDCTDVNVGRRYFFDEGFCEITHRSIKYNQSSENTYKTSSFSIDYKSLLHSISCVSRKRSYSKNVYHITVAVFYSKTLQKEFTVQRLPDV